MTLNVEIDPEIPVQNRVNGELLLTTLGWAYDQWLRSRRGEVSEWEQGDWMVPTIERVYDDENLQPLLDEGVLCGTSCCIAGKIAYDLGYRIQGKGSIVKNFETGHEELVSIIARRNLGLTEDEGDDLFSGDNNIVDLYRLAEQWTDRAIRTPEDVRAVYGRVSA